MTSLLPINLQDDSFLALEQCTKDALQVDTKAFMTSVIDFIDEESDILSFLAEQFHVLEEGWSSCQTRTEQISLIKKAVALHRKKGTVGAVEDLLDAFGAKCKIWRDYGGIPHHFKIDVDYFDKKVDIYNEVDSILSRLEQYKQLRAKLDEINFSLGIQKKINIANAVLVGEIIEVRF